MRTTHSKIMPDLTFIHLTDLHILASEEAHLWQQRTAHKLRHIIAQINDMDIAPDFFVLTGDLVHNGEEAEYQTLNKLLDELRGFGVPLLLGLGNHDQRVPFRRVLLGEDTTDESERYYHSSMCNGLRVIMLDSRVAGQVQGTLDAPQLAWLAEELQTPAPLGNLIAVHHPPVYSTVEPLNAHILSNPDDLAKAIAGHTVHAILSGHIHYAHITSFHDTLSITTYATAYTFDPGVQQQLRVTDGSGFTLGSLRRGRLFINPITWRDQVELRAPRE